MGHRWRGALRLARARYSTRASPKALPSEVPVLIVGAGPVGVTLSILLSRLGVRSLLVERKAKLSDHPQAHFINNRTMEIFRRIDGIGSEIQALEPPLDHWRKFVYCTSLDGRIIGEVNHFDAEDLASDRSPTSVAHFSQHRLLPLLLSHAKSLGISINGVWHPHTLGSICMGRECLSVRPSADAVHVEIEDEAGRHEVACWYLVASDGAGSRVRKSLGLKLEGESNLQQLINVHFSSRKLGQYLADYRPAMLYFVFNPSTVAVIVAHDLRCGEFVAQIPFYPPQQSAEQFTKDVCRKIIFGLASIPDMDVEVKAVKSWVMHAEVAEKFISGQGRVFLAGDAAHRFPPAGGFGMNTGIQDAHNLAWKLAATLDGVASPTLLQSYEDERRPVALANTSLSVSNFKAATSIPAALGLDPVYARTLHEAINGSMLPKSLQSALLGSAFSIGRAQVSPLFLNEYNPVAQRRMSEVKKILQDGKSLQLQFPSEDLFFRYTRGALVNETAVDEVKTTGRQEKVVPSSIPGVRLPHMAVRVDTQEEACSTLDLINSDKVEFVLFVGSCCSGLAWAKDAVKASPVPLKVVIVEQEQSEGNAEKYQEELAQSVRVRTAGDWWKLCSLPHFGALLVRPDDHIAWKSSEAHSSGSLQQLEDAFFTILGTSRAAQSSVDPVFQGLGSPS